MQEQKQEQKQDQDQTFKTLLEVSPQQVQPINWDIFWDTKKLSQPIIVGGGRRVSLRCWREARIYINSVAPAVDSRTGNHYAKSGDSLGYIDYDGVYYAPKEGLPGDYTADDVDAVVNAFRLSQSCSKHFTAALFSALVYAWLHGSDHVYANVYNLKAYRDNYHGTGIDTAFMLDGVKLYVETLSYKNNAPIKVRTEYGDMVVGSLYGQTIHIYEFAIACGLISEAAIDLLVKLVESISGAKKVLLEPINVKIAKAILDGTRNDSAKAHFDNLVVSTPSSTITGSFDISDPNLTAAGIAAKAVFLAFCSCENSAVLLNLDTKDRSTAIKAIVSYLVAAYDSASVLAAQIKIGEYTVDVKQVLKDIAGDAQGQKHSQKSVPTKTETSTTEPTTIETTATESITTETTAATPKKVVSTLPISKSWVMSRAWAIRKAIAAQLGCKVRDVSMSYALRRAWAEAKAKAELDTTVYYATVNGAVVGYATTKSEAQKLAKGGSVTACTLPKAE